MDKKELERRLEAAEKQNIGLIDEIKNLKAKLEDMQNEPEIPDMPVFHANETCWSAYFTLRHIKRHVLQSDYDGECFNLFHTKEYADEFANKCKLIAMMLHCKWYLCRDFKGDYSYPTDKWVVYYGGLDNKFVATNSIHCDYGFVPFDTIDNAQKCADWINEHWKEDGNGEANNQTP